MEDVSLRLKAIFSDSLWRAWRDKLVWSWKFGVSFIRLYVSANRHTPSATASPSSPVRCPKLWFQIP
jgi:hypothetical protein